MNPRAAGAACVACGGKLSYFGPREGYEYFRCRSCGTLQLDPMPTPAELEAMYREKYATSGHINSDPAEWTAAAEPHYRGMFDTLVSHGARGPVIDYGGGWGGLTRKLLAAGIDARVVEPSDDMAAYCARVGIPITHGGLDSLASASVNTLALIGVFEHLADHAHWLERVHTVLRPGGLLVVMQPTARCAAFFGTLLRIGQSDAELPALHQTFCPPWHTAIFSVGGMTRLAETHSFRLVEVRPGLPGRARGALGVAQRLLTAINRTGWAIAGTAWPLCVTHIFVFRRV